MLAETLTDLLTEKERAVAVAKAALHLDLYQTGWYERIDTERLDIASHKRCIFGQLGPTSAIPDSGLWYDAYCIPGFAPFASHEATPFWVAEIEARRG